MHCKRKHAGCFFAQPDKPQRWPGLDGLHDRELSIENHKIAGRKEAQGVNGLGLDYPLPFIRRPGTAIAKHPSQIAEGVVGQRSPQRQEAFAVLVVHTVFLTFHGVPSASKKDRKTGCTGSAGVRPISRPFAPTLRPAFGASSRSDDRWPSCLHATGKPRSEGTLTEWQGRSERRESHEFAAA